MITYPLPCPNKDSFSFYDDYGIINSNVPLQYSRAYFQAVRYFSVSFTYNTAQMAQLHDFIRTNLQAWFLMDLPSAVGMTPQVVRITSDVEATRTGPNSWEFSLVLERRADLPVIVFPVPSTLTYEGAGLTYNDLATMYGDVPVIPPLAATISTATLTKDEDCEGNIVLCPTPLGITTDAVSVTATGGTSPAYAYLWEWVSGDVFTINTPTLSATTFSTSLAHNVSKSGVYKCTITSALETVVKNVTVSISYTFTATGITLSADIDPATGTFDCTGTFGECATPAYIASAAVTISVVGGSGAITHSWSQVSGDTMTIISPSAGTTVFAGSLARNTVKNAVMRDTVTRGGDSSSIDVAVSLDYTFTFESGF